MRKQLLNSPSDAGPIKLDSLNSSSMMMTNVNHKTIHIIALWSNTSYNGGLHDHYNGATSNSSYGWKDDKNNWIDFYEGDTAPFV